MNAPQCGTTSPPWEGGDTPDPTSRAKIVIHPADGRYTRRMADTPGGWQTQKPNRVSNAHPVPTFQILNLENLKL